MLYLILKIIIAPFLLLFLQPVLVNRKFLKIKGKAIVIANHRHALDPVLIGILAPRTIHFMGKEELFKNPVSRALMKSLFVFPVKRKSADLKSMKQAIALLEDGKVFGIFPEGTRAVTDNTDTFEKGAAYLALCSGAPVIPVYIPNDAYRLFKRSRIYVGEPILMSDYVSDKKRSIIVDQINGDMESAVEALKVRHSEECA